ncbi:MAG: hypothetical protein FWD62_05300 [Betaproteobacteria bacterium]|nr:hypothetical protein [Betaproteobacteria bacterium]
MPNSSYDSFKDDVYAGKVTKTSTYKVMLLDAGYDPSQAHTSVADLRAYEISGAGYTAGGASITPTFVKDKANHRQTITFPNAVWSNSTINGARYAVYYVAGANDAASPLVACNDLTAPQTTLNGTLTVNALTINDSTPA